MADPIQNPSPSVPVSVPVSPAPISTASLPVDPAVVSGGAGATPPTASSATVPQPFTVRPDDQIEFGGVKLSIREAVEAKRQLEAVGNSGFSDFQAAMQGDRAAAMRLLQKFEDPAPVQPTQPAQTTQPTTPAIPPGWDEVVAYVQAARAKEVTAGLESLITSKPEYAALSKRPGVVAEVIQDLNILSAGGQKVSSTVVDNLLRLKAQREQQYQDALVGPYKQKLGELGVDDPFRGGTPQVLNEPKADPKDWGKYKAQLGARFQAAIAQARAAQGLNSPNVI